MIFPLRLFLAFLALFLPFGVSASVIQLDITGSWVAADYDVSSTGPDSPAGIPEEDDDLVFGTSPSDGSITFSLLVDTASPTVFNTGDFGVTHDWYGYSNVTLKAPVSFGSATWDGTGILNSLVGPNGATAALWTDTDLTAAAPSLLSFRMFGDWEGATADVFFGSRTATTISESFLMWEYFNGEEIRSASYSANLAPVPLPAGMVMLMTGLAGLGGFGALRRHKH